MYKDTVALRDGLQALLAEVETGTVSNTAARTRVNIAKAIIDTVKIEIAAAALGTEFKPLALTDKRK